MISETGIIQLWKTSLHTNLLGDLVALQREVGTDNLYVACAGNIYQLSARTGAINWKAELSVLPVYIDVKIAGHVIVGSCNGYVYGVGANGEKLWECNLAGSGYRPVILMYDNGIIYASSMGYVFAIMAESGQIVWKNSNEGQGFAPISTTLLRDGVISLGMRGHLRKANLTDGQKLGHSFNLKGTGYSLVAQLLFQNTLYAGSFGYITAHNPLDYNIIWKNELSGFGVNHGMTLVPYITSVSYTPCILVGLRGYVICLHAHSGVIQWTYSLESTGYGFVGITTYKKYVIVGSFGKLFLLNGDDGLPIAKDDLAGYGYGEIMVVNE